MRVATKVPSDQQLCFEHKFIGSCLRRRRMHYWRCCRPDESCRRRAPKLQPASPHILRCPDRYHRSTNIGGGCTLTTPLRTSFELVWGGLKNYYISDPVVGRVLLATMPGEISCPLDGEKEKDQIAPAVLVRLYSWSGITRKIHNVLYRTEPGPICSM